MPTALVLLSYIVSFVKLISVIILLVGLVLCLAHLVTAASHKKINNNNYTEIQKSKNNLGWFVLLGLEILIIADIIESIIHPTLEDIIRLAAIVAIRTVISYFLNKEIKETDSAIEQMGKSEKE